MPPPPSGSNLFLSLEGRHEVSAAVDHHVASAEVHVHSQAPEEQVCATWLLKESRWLKSTA